MRHKRKQAKCHPEKLNKAKGLCSPCYQQYRKSPDFIPFSGKLTACHPDRKHHANGLCDTCYKRARASDSVISEYFRCKRLITRYGITSEIYESLKRDQNNVCAICYRPDKKALVVDHNHFTGKVRGLLCGPCNRAIGLLQDNVTILEKAVEYFRKNNG